MRDFDEWLSKFRPSISSYAYYIDFEKVVRNVEEIKDEKGNDYTSLAPALPSRPYDIDTKVTKISNTNTCGTTSHPYTIDTSSKCIDKI